MGGAKRVELKGGDELSFNLKNIINQAWEALEGDMVEGNDCYTKWEEITGAEWPGSKNGVLEVIDEFDTDDGQETLKQLWDLYQSY